jgi:polysaccharide pyruvyl transferase CsaB
MKAKKILILGNYGAGNLGDETILTGLKQALHQLNPNVEIKCGPHYPSGIRSFFSKQRKNTKQVLQWADLAIIGGGGLFVDTGSTRAPFIWFMQAWACKQSKTPYIFAGVSFGPIKKKFNQKLTKWATKNAKAILVRDKASESLVKYLFKKTKAPKITLGTDFALHFLLSEQDLNSPIHSRVKSELQKKENQIVLSLRKWPNFTRRQFLNFVQIIREQVERAGYQLILLPFDLSQQEELAWMQETGVLIKEIKSLPKLVEEIARSKGAIMMRLHANIYSLTLEVPSFSLSYSTKVSSFLESSKLQPASQLKLLKKKSLENELKIELEKFLQTLSSHNDSVKKDLAKQDFTQVKALMRKNLDFLASSYDLDQKSNPGS